MCLYNLNVCATRIQLIKFVASPYVQAYFLMLFRLIAIYIATRKLWTLGALWDMETKVGPCTKWCSFQKNSLYQQRITLLSPHARRNLKSVFDIYHVTTPSKDCSKYIWPKCCCLFLYSFDSFGGPISQLPHTYTEAYS